MTAAAVTIVGALGHQRTVDVRAATRELPRGAETALVDALLPRLEADAAHDRFDTALRLTAALHRRAWELPALQSLADRARRAADDATVRTAVGLWLAPPATRPARVAAVLATDPSTIVIRRVQDTVERSRTDLLDDLLRRPPRGRFLRGKGHHVPDFRPAPGRWLPRQLRAFATLLESIARDTARPAWERAWAIRLRGPLPGGADVLGRLAHRPGSDGPEAVTVVEAALAALGHADDPRAAVAVLLAHVDGDRARVAVPATRRCVDLLAPARGRGATRPAARLAEGHHTQGRRAADGRPPPPGRGAAAAHLREHVRRAPRRPPGGRRRRGRAAARTGRARTAVARSARRRRSAGPPWPRPPGRPGSAPSGRRCRPRTSALMTTATWRQALAALVRGCELRGDGTPLLDLVDPLLDRLGWTAPDRDQPARQRLRTLAGVGPAVRAHRCGRRPGRSPRGSTAPWTGPPSTSSRARRLDPSQAAHDDLRGVAARTGPCVTTAVDGLAAGVRGSPGTTVRTALRALAETDAVGAAVAVAPRAGVARLDLREHPDRRVRGDARDVVIDPE